MQVFVSYCYDDGGDIADLLAFGIESTKEGAEQAAEQELLTLLTRKMGRNKCLIYSAIAALCSQQKNSLKGIS